MKKKIIIVALILIVLAAAIGFGISKWKDAQEITPEEMISRIENALGDEYKKQLTTELVGTLRYADKEGNEIKYHILKSTYYEADPANVTGLNVDALGILFDPDSAVSCEEMMIQEWHAALYVLEERSYLCWTCSPEESYILEYNPKAVSDADIIKMAESAKRIEQVE